MAEYPRYHSNCGGELHYHETVTENIIVNKWAVKKYGEKARIKQMTKTYYLCNKCNDKVNIITFPSWEEYVMMGQIRVPYYVFKELKNKFKGDARNAGR